LWGYVLEVQHECFKEFPNQCNGCPEYQESWQDYTEQLIMLAGMTFAYPQQLKKIVKECKVFHKRVVEYQK
jgi:hypothetical protein